MAYVDIGAPVPCTPLIITTKPRTASGFPWWASFHFGMSTLAWETQSEVQTRVNWHEIRKYPVYESWPALGQVGVSSRSWLISIGYQHAFKWSDSAAVKLIANKSLRHWVKTTAHYSKQSIDEPRHHHQSAFIPLLIDDNKQTWL